MTGLFKCAVLAGLLGCAHFPPLHSTEKYQVQVHIRADVAVDPLTVLAWVDMRVDEWLEHKTDWGCGSYDDATLIRAARFEPVIVYGSMFLSKGGSRCAGFNSFDEGAAAEIDVTIDFPALRMHFPYDPDYVNRAGQNDFAYSYGLRQLPHEWTHTVRGYWHPEVGF